MKFSPLLFAAVALLICLPLLHAEDDSSFDIGVLNGKAIQELTTETQFLSELTEKPEIVPTFLWVFPYTDPEVVGKLDLAMHARGVRGILSCLQTADNREDVWNELTSVAPGQVLKCGVVSLLDASAAACVAYASSVSPLEISTLEHPNCYNPVVAALLRTYRTKTSTSYASMEDKVANSIWLTANKRPLLSESLLDLSRLKYRYDRDPELKMYVAEDQLTDDDRKGIAILAQCLRENAPMKQIVLYASRGEMPPEQFLRNLKCLRAGGSFETLKDLQAHFARLGQAAMGVNLFTARQYSGVPSVLYPYFKAQTEQDRKAALAEVYAIDDFVNNHVAFMRNLLYPVGDNPSFKGVGKLKAEERIVLTHLMTRRFMLQNEGRLKNVRILKAIADGATSCALGDNWKDNVRLQAIGAVLKVASTGPPAFKAGAFVGNVVLVGMMVYSTVSSVDNLLQNYQKLSGAETLAEVCNVAQGAMGLSGMKSLGKEYKSVVSELKEVRRTGGSTFKYLPEANGNGRAVAVTPKEPQRKPVEKAKPTETNVQTKSNARKKTDETLTYVAENPDGVAKKFVDEHLEATKPSASAKKETQRALERQQPDAVTKIVAEVQKRAKLELDLWREKAKSKNVDEAFAARKKLEERSNAYLVEVFNARFSESEILLIKTQDGTFRMLYELPPGETHIPKKVKEKVEKYLKDLQTLGVEPSSKLRPHPEGYYIDSTANYFKYAKDQVKTYFACSKGRLSPSGAWSFSSDLTDSKSIWSFDQGVACPRAEQLFGLLRGLVTGELAAGGSTTAAERRHRIQREAREIRDGLPEHFKPLFDEALKASTEGKFSDAHKALADLAASRKSAGLDFDEKNAKFILLALDPDIKTMNPFGSDFHFFEALAKPGEQRAYEAQLITGMIQTPSKSGKANPHFDPTEFKNALDHYGNVEPSRKDFFTKLNEELPTQLDHTVSALTEKKLGLDDVVSINLDRSVKSKDGVEGLLGSGGFRDAYLLDIKLKDGSTQKVVAKTGYTHPKEYEWMQALTGKEVAPEVYGYNEGIKPDADKGILGSGLLLQEHVEGTPLEKKLESVTPAEEAALVRSIAENDAKLALSLRQGDGTDMLVPVFRDGSKENYVVRKKDGKVINVDLDPKLAVFVPLDGNYEFNLLVRDLDFHEAAMKEYLPATKEAFQSGITENGATKTFGHLFDPVMQKVESSLALAGQQGIDLSVLGICGKAGVDATGYNSNQFYGRGTILAQISKGQFSIDDFNRNGNYDWDVRAPKYFETVGIVTKTK